MTLRQLSLLVVSVYMVQVADLDVLCAREVKVIAHRGNSSEAPENTFAAFQSAAKEGYDFIECDIHLSKEGIPVVIHDRVLYRTIDLKIPVAVNQMSVDQIQALDAGSWYAETFRGQKVLTLKELLGSSLGEIGCMIEIKSGSASAHQLAEKVAHEVRIAKEKSPERAIAIASFCPEILSYVRHYSPEIPIIAIFYNQKQFDYHVKNNPDFFASSKKFISEQLVNTVHQLGKDVWVWTVDAEEEMEQLVAFGVDGIITNCPRKLRELVVSESAYQ